MKNIKILFLILFLIFFSCRTKKVTRTYRYEIRDYNGYYFQYYEPPTYNSVPYKKDSLIIEKRK